MSKFKHTGTMRGVTPMGKTMPQNLPKSQWRNIGASVDADEALGAFRAAFPELAEIELRIVSVFHEEIVCEVKK